MLEEEKHWDYICLTILTIATAALAGLPSSVALAIITPVYVFFILGT